MGKPGNRPSFFVPFLPAQGGDRLWPDKGLLRDLFGKSGTLFGKCSEKLRKRAKLPDCSRKNETAEI